MVKVVSEEEFELAKNKLNEQLDRPIIEDFSKYTSYDINWIELTEDIRARNLLECGKSQRLFFLANSKDTIIGKPQLVENTLKRIVLLRKVKKIIKTMNGEEVLISFKFIGDSFDKRYDGQEIGILALDFWIYKVVNEKGKEYYLLSKDKLPNEVCEFKGMDLELSDLTEFSKNMRIKSLSNVFIVKDCIPSVKILPKEDLVTYTKTKQITEQEWLDFLALHPQGNINRFPQDVELLRSAFILSGKTEGYPLHLAILGPAGTKKTMGHIETLAFKFAEDPMICEGANSRIKGLSPSFKEKPADIGFLAKSYRIGFVDEISKMVELEINKHEMQIGNILGELNFLLEHKLRTVSSGNNNECRVQATAKFLFVTNPVKGKNKIYSHVGVIDPTTMSRMLWWVQDSEEVKFALSPESVVTPISCAPHTYARTQEVDTNIKNTSHEKLLGGWCMCGGKVGSREEFLTLFDTCYSFLSNIDEKEIQRLVLLTTNLAKEPMKSSVWKPRATHHIKLLIDGLCKHRCLFKDYDNTFVAKKEDYELAERILIRMIFGWESNFDLEHWKEDFKAK